MAFAKYFLIPVILLVLTSSVIADDDDFNTQLMRITVKISHDKSTGTGFVLSAADGKKLVLVTAAHVFELTPGDETTVIFRSLESEGAYKKVPTKLVIRKEGKPTWTKHPTEDVAAIGIVPPDNADLPRIPFDRLASDELLRKLKVHPGENLCCLGFPHRNESSDAGFPILRRGAIATFPLLPTAKTKTFTLSANTFEGDSGGPVYFTKTGDTPADPTNTDLIMGLVVGQWFLDEEAKMIYGTTKVRHRLGLAKIVHASFIKETIDRLP